MSSMFANVAKPQHSPAFQVRAFDKGPLTPSG